MRYRGYYYDSDLDLYYLATRYYDPEVRRFVTADSYVSTGQGILGHNRFAYCGNNPIVRVDVCGNAWETIFDIASLGYSISDVMENPDDDLAWLGLAGDVVDLLPIVSCVGESVRAARATDATNELVKSSDAFRDIIKYTDDYSDLSDDLRKNRKALHQLAKEINRNANNGYFISYDEALIFDEWCFEYGVSQHHSAEIGNGTHWVTGWDHTHWQDMHIPFK